MNSQASAPPIVLVHGLWLTPRSWEGWRERFESRGHRVRPPAELRSGFPVLKNPANRNRTVELTPKQFHYGFTNTMAGDEAKAAYDRYQVPGPGRVIFQAALANLNPRAVTKVDFHKDDRPPLLTIGNDKDHSKEAAQRLGESKAAVDYKEFAGRPHFTAGASGWEEVADYALDCANRHTGAPAGKKAPATA